MNTDQALGVADAIRIESGFVDSVEPALIVLAAEVRRLQAENERLRKDAERIDWISRQYLDGLCLTLVVDADHDGEYYVAGDDNQTGYGPTLRAAIDAARSSKALPEPAP